MIDNNPSKSITLFEIFILSCQEELCGKGTGANVLFQRLKILLAILIICKNKYLSVFMYFDLYKITYDKVK